MAILWENKKKFQIIKMSWREYAAATDSWGLCDACGQNSSEEPLYYVAVLNVVFCPDCFDAWYGGAKRYSVDMPKEQANFVRMKQKMKDLGCWE
jgi:hypothetical protein